MAIECQVDSAENAFFCETPHKTFKVSMAKTTQLCKLIEYNSF